MSETEKHGPVPHQGLAATLVLGLIRGYQISISPFLGPRCRFEPSCSNYAVQAISRWGLVRGFILALKRISRCHPFHSGGLDPVP